MTRAMYYFALAIAIFAANFLHANATEDETYEVKYRCYIYMEKYLVTSDDITDAAQLAIDTLGNNGTIVDMEITERKGRNVMSLFSIKLPKSFSPAEAYAEFSTAKFDFALEFILRQRFTDPRSRVLGEYLGPSDAQTTGLPTRSTTYWRPSCGKRKMTAALLSTLLGTFGAGRFYYGYTAMGLLKMLLGVSTHAGITVFLSLMNSKAKNIKIISKTGISVALVMEIAYVIWWMWDMFVFWGGSLKPHGKPSICDFDLDA